MNNCVEITKFLPFDIVYEWFTRNDSQEYLNIMVNTMMDETIIHIINKKIFIHPEIAIHMSRNIDFYVGIDVFNEIHKKKAKL